jgi:hypothetical protein
MDGRLGFLYQLGESFGIRAADDFDKRLARFDVLQDSCRPCYPADSLPELALLVTIYLGVIGVFCV